MCQRCVLNGDLTQDELDQRILAGDNSVVSITDMSPDLAAQTLAGLAVNLILEGKDPELVLDYVDMLAESYSANRQA